MGQLGWEGKMEVEVAFVVATRAGGVFKRLCWSLYSVIGSDVPTAPDSQGASRGTNGTAVLSELL